MRFGIFVVMAGREAGGPETYEHELVRSLAATDGGSEYHIFCLSEGAAASFGVSTGAVRYHVLRPGARWLATNAGLPWGLVAHGIDLLHATFVPPLVSPRDYVFTMHCFSTFAHPEFYHPRVLWQLNHLIRLGLRRARLVICVSRNVRDLVAERFKLPEERLAVVYHGVSERFRPTPPSLARERVREKYGVDGPFALFVGQIKARKNVYRLLEAFARFRHEFRAEMQLVLAGRRDWSARGVDETIERLGLAKHVVELGHLAHEDLPALYAASEMFVFPSLWEGFGLPVIEAMACGTPVVTSNKSCLPEIAGDAALLVDPYSPDAIAEAMLRVVSDRALRGTLRARGLERAAQFTWKRTAEETLGAYRQAASV